MEHSIFNRPLVKAAAVERQAARRKGVMALTKDEFHRQDALSLGDLIVNQHVGMLIERLTAQGTTYEHNQAIVNERDATGMTPLMHAALHLRGDDCRDTVVALLNCGADPLATDFAADRSALHWACEADNCDFVDAFEQMCPQAIRYLQLDADSRSPYVIAREKQFRQLLEHITQRRMAGLKPLDANHGYRIAVIGMGVTGTAFFIHLVKRLKMSGDGYRELCKRLTIHLIDDKSQLGQGTPYSPELNASTSLLNIAAGGMSIDPEEPLDFVLWLKQLELTDQLEDMLAPAGSSGQNTCPTSARVDGYYTRWCYGRYTAQRLQDYIAMAGNLGIKVDPCPNSFVAQQIGRAEGEITLTIRPPDAKEAPHPGGDRSIVVDAVFYATGTFTEKCPSEKAWKDNPLVVQYPANVRKIKNATLAWIAINTGQGIVTPQALEAAEAQLQDIRAKFGGHAAFNVAVFGASLSAIDAIFACLLRPDVGHLTWVGDKPTYHWNGNVKVTCFSRRGVFSRVRPAANRDIVLKYLNPFNLSKLMAQAEGGRLGLEQVISLLQSELNDAFKTNIDLKDLVNPLGRANAQYCDPFKYLADDLREAENGDNSTPGHGYVLWYQVIHSLLGVVAKLYRQFTPKDREAFDRQYSSNFLWAFSPMPPRSAAILLAMHEAEALDLFRSEGEPKIVEGGRMVEIKYHDMKGGTPVFHSNILLDTTGLANDFGNDASPFTDALKTSDLILQFEPKTAAGGKPNPSPDQDRSMWMADDGSFEILDAHHDHSPARRGVGYNLHSQMWDVQAVPLASRYARLVAGLYFDELRWRFEMAFGKQQKKS